MECHNCIAHIIIHVYASNSTLVCVAQYVRLSEDDLYMYSFLTERALSYAPDLPEEQM